MIPQRPTRVGDYVSNLILVLESIEKSDGYYEKERKEYKQAAADRYQHMNVVERKLLSRVKQR